MELDVRPLQTIDLFRVAKIIQKATSASRETLINTFGRLREQTPDGADMTPDQPFAVTQAAQTDRSNTMQELGFALFEAAIDQEQAIKELFAGLVGMKVPEFDKTPIDTILVILERLVEQEDLPAFLSRASALAGRMMNPSG